MPSDFIMVRFFKIAALLILLFLLYGHFVRPYYRNIQSLRHRNPTHTAYMGEPTRTVKQDWVSLESISKNLVRAVVVAEDGRFFQHWGIDFFEFKESLKKNAKNMAFSRGFSTITMQLARNLYLSPEKNISRKAKEIVIALLLEYELSKDRILELYLNLIEWGRGIYGIEAASHYYFKKSASQLNPGEAAFLAAIIPSPQRLGRLPPSPYVEQRVNSIMERVKIRWQE
jgi:monofunctional biosynthetic peptidoglycan transglycosylase